MTDNLDDDIFGFLKIGNSELDDIDGIIDSEQQGAGY